MSGKLCFQTVKLFIIQGEPIHLTIRFWENLFMYCIYICAVHLQVLQKPKTMCFTSCSKGTCVILPFGQKVILCSRFPDEEYIDLWISHSHLYVEWQHKPQEKEAPYSCLHWKKLLCRPFEESNLSRGKPSRTVKQRDSNKRLFWCEGLLESF